MGIATASAFGPEIIKTFVGKDTTGRWWFIALFLSGVLVIGVGLWQREQRNRVRRIAIVVNLTDAQTGVHRAKDFVARATRSFEEAGSIALTVDQWFRPQKGPLPPDAAESVDRAVEVTLNRIELARSLSPTNTDIDLVPNMRLHAAFRFGAKLRHAPPVTLQQSLGAPDNFFSAVLLINREDNPSGPLTVVDPEPLFNATEKRPTGIALAVNITNNPRDFYHKVRATCINDGYAWLVYIHNPGSILQRDEKTFTAAVDQICHAWRDATAQPALQLGRPHRRAIFLCSPVSIAVALGARLASAAANSWTPYTYDEDEETYEPLPPPTTSQP